MKGGALRSEAELAALSLRLQDDDQRGRVWGVLRDLDDREGPISYLIHGYETGAEIAAMDWAAIRGIRHTPYGGVDLAVADIVLTFAENQEVMVSRLGTLQL